MIEWSDLSTGDIIKWMPFVNGNQTAICILLMSKYKEDDIFSTIVLDGFFRGYDANRMYRQLLTPTGDDSGTTTMSRHQYEKCKSIISFIDETDAQRIKKYLDGFANDYYTLYLEQKSWANQMSDKVNQFIDKKVKVK